MRDFRPVGHAIGWLVQALGLLMVLPALLDIVDGSENWRGMMLAAFLTVAGGLALSLITRPPPGAPRMTRRQAFLLTVLVWAALPIFGALPFIYGAPDASYTDAYFEAMSGMTTTGATVFTGLDSLPRGTLLWRGLMQWLGGVGIVVFAIVFLPMMRVGGMQFFRSEGFDVGTDVLPRATTAALELGYIYVALTVACVLAYSAAGMNGFDSIVHAMTTVSTGGYGNYDGGFGVFPVPAQWVAVLFMWLGAMPFLRMMQISRGRYDALWQDSQVRAFLAIVFVVSGVVASWLMYSEYGEPGRAAREALFNVTSVMTGTGYAASNYSNWGGLAVGLIFVVGLIGGCTGSTSCSAKVFRYQVLFKALSMQIRRIHTPHGVFPLRFNGRPVDPEVVSSIMGFFFFFFTALVVWAVLLSLLGLDLITSVSGSVAALCNIGPGLGPIIGPVGSYAPLPDEAKWLLSVGMLLGRLEFLSVLVLFTRMFWAR